MRRRFLIVHNPVAGGRKRGRLRRVVAALAAGGHEVELYATRGPGDAATHLRARQGRLDVVVAAGGDGTVNEVVNGLAGRAYRALGVLPLGTTNVLARELGLPRTVAGLAAVLVGEGTTAVYPGLADGRRFVMWVGAGIDGWVVSHANLRLKRWFGRLAYGVSFFAAARRFGRVRFQVRLDGESVEAWSVIASRGRLYAGSFVLSERARLDSPALVVMLLQDRGLGALLRYGSALLGRGLEGASGVVVRTAAAVTIATEPDKSAGCTQIDGDPGAPLPLRLSVDPQPVRVLTGERSGSVLR